MYGSIITYWEVGVAHKKISICEVLLLPLQQKKKKTSGEIYRIYLKKKGGNCLTTLVARLDEELCYDTLKYTLS